MFAVLEQDSWEAVTSMLILETDFSQLNKKFQNAQ